MKFEHLFSPMQVGKVTYRNRIVSAPMAFGLIVQNPDARDFTYRKLEASAKGGNGCVIVGETDVNFTDAVRIPGFRPFDFAKPEEDPETFDAVGEYARRIKRHGAVFQPRTFLFGAKASPGYYMAKEIIRFICALGELIDRDVQAKEMIRVIFLADYRVSLAEIIYPAAEISEQISQAGKEASGTGNMKMMLNGALTLGTMDGANIEIFDAVGKDNIFIFGMNTEEVNALYRTGYHPHSLYDSDPEIREVLDFIRDGGIDGKKFDSIVGYLLNNDTYMSLADFESYRQCQAHVADVYRDPTAWNRMSLLNIANTGIFSADRAVKEYIDNIWYK